MFISTARALRSPQLRLSPALLFALIVACLLPALAPAARPAAWPPATIPRAGNPAALAEPSSVVGQPSSVVGQPSSQIATGQSQRVLPGMVPIGLSAPEWQSIQRQIAAGPYRAYPQADGGYDSANPAQGWQIRYGADGMTRLSPRDRAAPPWQWGLRLAGYGSATLTPLGRPHALDADGQTLTYQWDATLSEWWQNDPYGLEQGFTLRRRPAGSAEGQPLRLELALSGDLRAELGDGVITFYDQAGAAAFTYAGLRAWDAAGHALPSRMALADGRISLIVADAGATYPLTIDPTVQQAQLTNPNPTANGYFGWSVAIDGDTVVVGTFGEYGGGIAGHSGRSDNSIANADSGTAYIFVRSGTSWRPQAYLKPSDAEADDWFGASVAIDGDTVVVGASGEASSNPSDRVAYVYVRSGDSWVRQAYLKASNAEAGSWFGASVAIDGDTIVVGSLYDISKALKVDTLQSDNGDPDDRAAYVFVRDGSTWSQQAYLKGSNTEADDQFGHAVAIAGDTIVVGAIWEDSSATGVNGDQHDNSALSAGAAYVFVRDGDAWVQQAYLKAANTGAEDNFGISVAIAGDTIVVGAPYEDSGATGVNGDQHDNRAESAGAAYVFVRDGDAWVQQAYLKASNAEEYDWFGTSVAIAGSTVVVGASGEDSGTTRVNGDQSDNSALWAGAAYVFVRNKGSWSQQDYLKTSRTGIDDRLGYSVTIAGDTVVVGAYAEYGGHIGGGAAYVFALPPTDSTLPTVTIEQAAGQDDPAGSSPVAFTVTFSEAVSGFDATDVTLGGTAGATTADISGGPAVYTVEVSGMAGDGTVSVSIPAGVAEDAAGNLSAASTSADNVITFAPATPVATGIARADADPTNAASVSFTVTFSEDVTGVDAGDFTLTSSGLGGASIGTVSGSGGSYTVNVSTGTGSGSLRLSLADDDSIADGAGNPLGGAGLGNGSFNAGQVYTIDRAGPTGTLSVSNITAAVDAEHPFTVRFADPAGVDVGSLDGADIRVTGPNGFSQLAAFVSVDVSGNGTPRTATYRITAPGGTWGGTDNGSYSITLLAGQVHDALGNPAAAAALGSFEVDLPTPGPTIYLPIIGRPG